MGSVNSLVHHSLNERPDVLDGFLCSRTPRSGLPCVASEEGDVQVSIESWVLDDPCGHDLLECSEFSRYGQILLTELLSPSDGPLVADVKLRWQSTKRFGGTIERRLDLVEVDLLTTPLTPKLVGFEGLVDNCF